MSFEAFAAWGADAIERHAPSPADPAPGLPKRARRALLGLLAPVDLIMTRRQPRSKLRNAKSPAFAGLFSMRPRGLEPPRTN